jgi:hypothetical protein
MTQARQNGIRPTKRLYTTMSTEYTAEDTAEHIRGLQDVADLIRIIIAGNYPANLINPESPTALMGRQTGHIRIMLAMPHIQASGVDLTPFETAANDGETWANSQ